MTRSSSIFCSICNISELRPTRATWSSRPHSTTWRSCRISSLYVSSERFWTFPADHSSTSRSGRRSRFLGNTKSALISGSLHTRGHFSDCKEMSSVKQITKPKMNIHLSACTSFYSSVADSSETIICSALVRLQSLQTIANNSLL